MVKKSLRPRKGKEMKVVRSSDHRSHYVTGAIPQWTEEDIRIHFYNEVLEGSGGPYYISTTQIILPKTALPRLIETLKNAALTDDKNQRSEVTTMPLDVAVAVDREMFEIKKKAPRNKKVQKIRRK
ncbi:MAG: hypothetical protein U9R75_08615 [Candidatus Thermoplasmatota archaeon]|nr:hypothetical protein [Candidatus Thermoplasmatota archaeon]